MAKKVILGTDIARDAFKTKVNDNFTELYDKDVALGESINDLTPLIDLDYSIKQIGQHNIKNLIENGNFTDDTNKWNLRSTTGITNNGILTTTMTAGSLVSSWRIEQSIEPIVGHKYYVRAFIKPKYNNTTYIQFGGNTHNITLISNEWNLIQDIIATTSTAIFRFYHSTNTNYVEGDTVQFKDIMCIDLTACFGAGNEPTKEEMDIIIQYYPKDLLFDILDEIRKLKAAIVVLGGSL